MTSVAHVYGRIAGAAILTLFGAVWCMLALASWKARPSWSIPVGFVATIALIAWCVERLIALKNIPSIDDPAAAARGKRAGMFFGIIFGAEGGLIALCAVLLARVGLDMWIPIAAAVIVGLHFIPLARLFEVRVYYWTGAISVLGMLACSLIRDVASRQLCAGLVMAAVLWLTVIVVLLQARSMQPQRVQIGASPDR